MKDHEEDATYVQEVCTNISTRCIVVVFRDAFGFSPSVWFGDLAIFCLLLVLAELYVEGVMS